MNTSAVFLNHITPGAHPLKDHTYLICITFQLQFFYLSIYDLFVDKGCLRVKKNRFEILITGCL